MFCESFLVFCIQPDLIFVDLSDHMSGNQKQLSNWTLPSWSYLLDKNVWQTGCVNNKEDKQTNNESSNLKNLCGVFQFFFQQLHLEKRKNCRLLKVFCFLFQQRKNYLLKKNKKEAYFCAIRSFIADFCSHFDEPNRVSKKRHFSERTKSGVIDFADQLVFQFSETRGSK